MVRHHATESTTVESLADAAVREVLLQEELGAMMPRARNLKRVIHRARTAELTPVPTPTPVSMGHTPAPTPTPKSTPHTPTLHPSTPHQPTPTGHPPMLTSTPTPTPNPTPIGHPPTLTPMSTPHQSMSEAHLAHSSHSDYLH